jgi:hypothetical protein
LYRYDTMKVRGNIAEMARCLEDPDPRVASVARLLFTAGAVHKLKCS